MSGIPSEVVAIELPIRSSWGKRPVEENSIRPENRAPSRMSVAVRSSGIFEKGFAMDKPEAEWHYDFRMDANWKFTGKH